MSSIDTQKMMRMVAEKTGYDVSTTTGADMTSWGGMISASDRNPRHLVRVNTKYAQYGDYIVALQCAMLLVKWSDTTHVPFFILRQSTIDMISEQVSKAREIAFLSPDVRIHFSKTIIAGLLNQLQSCPTEMMAIEMCYETCPDLRTMQAQALKVSIRELTAVLQPQIKDRTPPDIFDRNAAMNAAFCLSWAERSGDKTVLIPFESLGFLPKGRQLFDAYRALTATPEERYVRIVDNWAATLEMRHWYEWQRSERINS